jgi:protein TonB
MMQRRVRRPLGWAGASLASAAILSTAALALVAERQPEDAPIFLAMSARPAAAPAVDAIADPAPDAASEAPALPDTAPLDESPLPQVPDLETAAPDRPPLPSPPAPLPDVPVAADIALPPPAPEPAPDPLAASPRPQPRPEPKVAKAEPPRDQDQPLQQHAAETAAAASATAPSAGAVTDGGARVSPAAYARAVMQQVRATRRQSGAGKGTVLVGFSIRKDGGLAQVVVLESSGNGALDSVALDHIRRSAPFPPPPQGAGRNFSFEFVGR